MRKGCILTGIIVLSAFLGLSVSAEESTKGEWILEQTVDDFGDVTEDSKTLVTMNVEGTFSNTATTDSELTAIIKLYPTQQNSSEQPCFIFHLLEYNDHDATYYESSKPILKTKVGDAVEEYTLYGFPPNGGLYLGDDYEEALVFKQTGYSMFDGSWFSTFADALYSGEDVRCVIEIDNSKYKFTVPSSNFKQICEELEFEPTPSPDQVAAKAIALAFSDDFYAANHQYKGYHIIDACREIEMALSKDAYPRLTVDEIKEKMVGDWIKVPYHKTEKSNDEWNALSISEDGFVKNHGKYNYEEETIDPYEKDPDYHNRQIDLNPQILDDSVAYDHPSYIFEQYPGSKPYPSIVQVYDLGNTWYLCTVFKEDGVDTGFHHEWFYLLPYEWVTGNEMEHDALDSNASTDSSTVYSDTETIKKVQEALNNSGYDCGTPDGDKGPKTTAVIQQYQTDNGLEATGEIDDALLSILGIQ